MSHHFDTPTALQDPQINIYDLYLFSGRPGTTVMAMTVNPDAGISAPDTFHDEGLYTFRFDVNRESREELTFTVRFGAVVHQADSASDHVQSVEVRREVGRSALHGAGGALIAAGRTGEVITGSSGVMAFAGLAPDLFAGDAAALGTFREALFKENRFDPGAFTNRQNFFSRRNVTAIAIEVPSQLIGHGPVRAWATVSLYGHAPEIQVSRWGLPLITNFFMPDTEMREEFNRTKPSDDQERFITQVSAVVAKVTSLAGSAANPTEYSSWVAARLFPTTLPYELGTPAAFDFECFNGRALTDDVMDVILRLVTNTDLSDGVAPDEDRTSGQFPYFGAPYSRVEQADIAPARSGQGRK